MVRLYQVDAFTNKAFKGNPAAVCILDTMPSEKWMQNVAREMNLSETAFVLQREDGYELRWFTPTVEMDLCGHATLAAAHILWSEGFLDYDSEAIFHTRSGILRAKSIEGLVQLDFPTLDYRETKAPKELIEALEVIPVYVGKSNDNYLIEVRTQEEVESIKPDFERLSKVDIHGVIVTSIAVGDYDFVSRFFAPGVGILEDPVTGSTHCVLVKYWEERLKKDNFYAYQLSERGGMLRLKLDGKRVKISGEAITILRGDLLDEDEVN